MRSAVVHCDASFFARKVYTAICKVYLKKQACVMEIVAQ